MQPHACTGGHPNTLLKFSTFDSDPGAVPQILEAAMGPMGLRHVWPFVLAPSGRSWQKQANTCLGLLLAHVGTWPCTWLHTASLFWHVNTFWRPLGHSLVTTRILAFFCHLWAAGMPTQLLGGPQGWVALKIGCICHAPTKMGTQSPTGKGMAWVPKHHFPCKRVLGFLPVGGTRAC